MVMTPRAENGGGPGLVMLIEGYVGLVPSWRGSISVALVPHRNGGEGWVFALPGVEGEAWSYLPSEDGGGPWA